MSTIFMYSEYMFSTEYTEPDTGHIMLTDPNQIGFIAFSDNIPHVVQEGDTLWGIADTYYAGFPRPCGFWKVVADFNAIFDPTIALEPGTLIMVPSPRTLVDTIFSSDRQLEVNDAIA